MSAVTAADVKALRDRTGAGMMACRNALAEADGDIEQAVELLRARGEAQAAKRAGAEAREGVVQSYIHAGNKIGVLVEVDCQTDFVARNEKFVEFARDLALHIAAAAPLAISDDDVPAEDREREERIATEQAADRPENVREKIVARQARQVARRGRAAAPEARQRGQARRQDDRGAARGARRRDRRERRHPPVRAVRRRWLRQRPPNRWRRRRSTGGCC